MTVAELFADGKVVVTVKKIRESEVSLVIHGPKALTIMRDDAKKRS
jgi:sRNA-binding carbon storage regulator CsrA